MNYGYPEWGDTTDTSIVLQNTLESQSVIQAAGMVIDDPSNISYNSNGMLLADTAGVNFYPALTAAQKTALQHNFTITVWIESGILDTLAPALQYLIAAYDGSSYFALAQDINTARFTFRTASGGNNSFTPSASRAVSGSGGKGPFVRVDWEKRGSDLILHFDKFPVMRWANGGVFANYAGITEFSLGAIVSGTGSQNRYRYKNLMVSTRPIMLPVRESSRHMLMMGHSFAENGDYGSVNQSGTGRDKASGNYDLRTLPTIHRLMRKAGRAVPAPYIRNVAVGGTYVATGANNMANQITAAAAMSSVFDIVFVQFGLNECTSSGTESFATTYPTWQADFQTQIDALKARGARKILIANVTSPAVDATYGTSSPNWATYRQRVDDANVIIAALVAANPECRLVDLFTASGGHNPDPALFNGSDRHRSNLGYRLDGELFYVQ